MVKLFVGNLADAVDSNRLRELFGQHVSVQECDVLKNFAFVHVTNEEDAKRCMEKLDNYMLEGRPIHIEKSTSRLRKDPGMGDKCFRCGGYDHKTPNCPMDKGEDSVRRPNRRRSPVIISNGGKRTLNTGPNFGESTFPPVKRSSSPLNSYYTQPQHQNYDPYRQQQPQPLQQPQDPYYRGPVPTRSNPSADPDPLMVKPRERDLEPIYEQYMEARQRYFYYRDRLTKEMQVRSQDPYSVSQTAPNYAQQQFTQYDYSAQAQQSATPVVRYVLRVTDQFRSHFVSLFKQKHVESYVCAVKNF